MIEKLTGMQCLSGLPDSVAAAKIKAVAAAYGDGASVYCQRIDGGITAVMGGMSPAFLSVCLLKNADIPELVSFFRMFGTEVFCSEADAAALGSESESESASRYELMRYSGSFSLPQPSHGKIYDLYAALQMGLDGDIELPKQDLFYTDMCIRYNHGAAEYALLPDAAAVCGFMTDKVSFITGVAVDCGSRRKGRGKAALLSLIAAIKLKYPDTKIYAAARPGAVEFYKKCGFKSSGRVVFLKY